jgi:small subunit ribosomal protein S8e
VYNASNNELVRTKTLVKGAIVLVDAHPFKDWYQSHYGVEVGKKKLAKKGASSTFAEELAKKSEKVKALYAKRQVNRDLSDLIDDQFSNGRLLASISSRPGQTGRVDGYILEGKELEFYQKMLARKKKGTKA